MNMEQMQQFKAMRKEIESLRLRVTELEAKAERKKPGPKPKRSINAV